MTFDANILLIASPEVSVSLGELLAFVRTKPLLKTLLLDAVSEKLIWHTARGVGLTATPEELQQAANRFRQQKGLSTVEATQTWLQQNALRVSDLEAILEQSLLGEKFRDYLMQQQLDR